MFYKISLLKNFFKIHKKTLVSESLFNNNVPRLHIATLLKEKTLIQVFSDKFGKIHKTPFYRTPPSDCFCSTEKYFATKIKFSFSLWKKKKNCKQLVRKTMTYAEKKLKHYLHEVFIFFYYSKISLFLFSLLLMIH